MNIKYKHISVMTSETITSLKIKESGIYIDSTFGMGGHSREILKKLGPSGKLYSIDKDPQAIIESKTIQDHRFESEHMNFSKIFYLAQKKQIVQKVDGILFDLGLSSPQIENSKRGFSFRIDGPLDMRMNPNHGISVQNWLLKSNVNKISYVLKTFGEEKFARRIACAIKKYQIKKNINSTLELVDIIKKAIPIKNKFKHPARKTFQALRIYINQELKELKTGLRETLKILKPGGRLTIISFHSLEDRIVKKFMVKNSTKAIVPYSMPITEKQLYNLKKVKLTVIDRIYPSQKEIQKNPKSRSSILRVAQFNKN